MGEPLDYDDYATKYRRNRWAVPWILEPLGRAAGELAAGARVLEIGCGTANYLIALSELYPELEYFGFDRSDGMLAEARARGSRARFSSGDADREIPFPSAWSELAFAVDVLHHLVDYDRLFEELRRVLAPRGVFLAVTDSGEDVRERSLTRLFPEALAIELRRYPDLDRLSEQAARRGLREVGREGVAGTLELDAAFVDKLEQKCASSLRLIEDEARRRGMDRVRAAAGRGELWQSRYTILSFAPE